MSKSILKSFLYTVTLCLLLCHQVYAESDSGENAESEYRELTWGDLVPEDWTPEPPSGSGMVPDTDFSNVLKDFLEDDAPVVEDLHKQKVKVPGFIIPTEFDDESISEFLLVPFMGACIHVPPPPSNQMVYVKLKEPMSAGQLWEPVWASGVILAKKQVTEFALAGYTMEDSTVSKYEYE